MFPADNLSVPRTKSRALPYPSAQPYVRVAQLARATGASDTHLRSHLDALPLTVHIIEDHPAFRTREVRSWLGMATDPPDAPLHTPLVRTDVPVDVPTPAQRPSLPIADAAALLGLTTLQMIRGLLAQTCPVPAIGLGSDLADAVVATAVLRRALGLEPDPDMSAQDRLTDSKVPADNSVVPKSTTSHGSVPTAATAAVVTHDQLAGYFGLSPRTLSELVARPDAPVEPIMIGCRPLYATTAVRTLLGLDPWRDVHTCAACSPALVRSARAVPAAEERPTLKVPEIAVILGVSDATIYSTIAAGTFPLKTLPLGGTVHSIPTQRLRDLLGLDAAPAQAVAS